MGVGECTKQEVQLLLFLEQQSHMMVCIKSEGATIYSRTVLLGGEVELALSCLVFFWCPLHLFTEVKEGNGWEKKVLHNKLHYKHTFRSLL